MSLNDAYPQNAAINAAAHGSLHSFLVPAHSSAHATPNTYDPPPSTTKASIFDPQTITQPVKQMLASHEAHFEAKFDNAVQLLLSEMSAARQESREHVGQIAEVLQKSHAINLARLKRLENIMGMGSDMENSDEKTLLSRFDLLSFAVEELLERLKDPEANFPDSLPLRRDAATSLIKRVDMTISPRTPAPRPQSSIAMRTPSYTDAYSINDPSSSTLVADDTVPFSNQKSSQVLSVPVDGAACIETAAVPKPTFRASLNPVNWANQDPADMRPVSVSPRPNQLSDDTVVSPTLGVGSSITTSRRSQSVHPVSPAFSVSPLQFPRETTPHFGSLADGTSVSSAHSPASEDRDGQTFVEEVESDVRLPSADAVREELSVQDLMSAQADMQSSQLQRLQAELSVECDKSTESNSEHQVTPSLRHVELDRVCFQLQNVWEGLDAEHEDSAQSDFEHHVALSSQDTKLDSVFSELRDVQEELHVEHDKWSQSDATQSGLQFEGVDNSFNVRRESVATPVHDGGNHQLPASPGPSDERPRKTPRRTLQHIFAVQRDDFQIIYVGDQFNSSPEQLLLPQPPEEGCNWQQIYVKHNLGQLAYAQLMKAPNELVKVDALCQHCRDKKQICLRRSNLKRQNEACLICLVGNHKCKVAKDNQKDPYPFKDQTVQAFVKLHNVAVRKEQKPGQWMGDGVSEFDVDSSWSWSPKRKRKSEA